MTNLAYTYTEKLIDDWHDCYLSVEKNTGMIATLDLSRVVYNDPKQFFWTYESLGKLLSITEREKPYTNVYLSLNAFRAVDGIVRRSARYLAQIRNIGIDLDCYKLGITPADCKERLIELVAHGKIPNPNLLINSGNGLQLIYSIRGGAAPTNELKWLAMYITRELSGQLIKLGADFQTCTLERVFRLPNTLNKKEGYPTSLVTVDVWNRREWTLNELMDYVKPYKPIKKRSKLRSVVPLRGYKKGARTLPQMNMARANDLLTLASLRNGDIENRNILSYDYAFSLALGSDMNYSEVLTAVLQLDSSFVYQQRKNVLKTTVKSAYEDAKLFWQAYEENNYRMIGLDKNLVKPKKTSTIIRHQAITDAEMELLEVLVGKAEKERRRTEKRRENGEIPREQYLVRCKEQTHLLQKRVEELKATGMKQKDIALELGISKGRVSQILKKV